MAKKIFFFISFVIIAIIIISLCFIQNQKSFQKDNGIPKLKITLNDVNLKTINSGSKDIKYKGNTVEITNADNEIYNFIENDVELKGRGNFSWTLQKKSYQIKFDTKKDVLGMGESKKWLLIANHADVSLMRNKLMYSMASKIGMPYTSESTWVDLYIDNKYQGNYLLTEKVEIGKNRVELEDEYGIIVELDNNYYYQEDYYFKTDISHAHFVLKESVAGDTDSKSLVALNNFRKDLNNFEELLYSKEKDWNAISSKIDVESFIKYYFIQELAENADAVRTSMYMYKDGDNDVLHMGPVWDFDLAVANCDETDWGADQNGDYLLNIREYMEKSIDWYTQLFMIPEFRAEAIRIYNEEIRDVFMTATTEIDENEALITDSANMNFKKWKLFNKENLFGKYRAHTYKSSYKEEVELLRTWVDERVKYLNEKYSMDSLPKN